MVPNKIYILTGNPFIYEVYDNFCQHLSYKLEPIIVKYSQNPNEHFRNLDYFFSKETHLETTILFAHSYGSYHAIKLYEKYNFHSCYLLGPFLMKPTEDIYEYIQTVGILEFFSVSIFKYIVLIIHHIILLLMPEFIFKHIFGIKKKSISNPIAKSIIDTIHWEQRKFAYINNLDYLKGFKKLKDIKLLRPVKDVWSNYKIYESWNPYNRRLLDIQHNFCLSNKDCKTISQTIFYDIS